MAAKRVISYLLTLPLLLRPSCPLPTNHTDPLVNAALDAGTFQKPSNLVRPRFRYWVPDASVDKATLAADVKAAGSAGAGGVEVLGYYLYGGTPQGTGTFAPDDWSVYGWGTPAWQSVFNTLAQAHKDNGMIMDFALGPNQGQGVPAPENSDGLMWDLYSYNISIPIGGSFNGVLPGWGMGELQAVITGLVIDSANASGLPPSLPGDLPYNRTQLTLATDSLQVVTDSVDSNGSLSLDFPSNSTGIEYNLFVVYLIHSGYRAQQDPAFLGGPQTVPQSYLQNGSWAVDHYSALGAQTVANFWEQYVLTNGTKELLMEVGNYAWEDSIEIRSNAYWTKNFTDVFSSNRGYDITKWLPILFHQNRLGFDSLQPTLWWITDEVDSGDSHVADYRETLGELYGTYVETLNSWAQSYLDLQFSAQISYNLPMDMLQNVPDIDAPECESLGFNHLIDGYRQYTGPANLAGKRVISTECGANHLDAFQQTFPSLLWDVQRSISGSVNQFVFHGFPYSGPYGNTTWPFFTTFDYEYSEMHGRHQPAWEYYSDAIDFAARLSYIFQSGIPKIDLAFYLKITTFPDIVQYYYPTDLEEAGYSYEYLSPDNFDLPEAFVQNGILAPNRQAFKALVVRGNDTLTIQGVSYIAEYANAGLPIIFSGGIPSYLGSYNASGAAYVNATLSSLTSLPNVQVVPYENLAASISSLSIQPLTKVSSNGSWYTYWRRDDSTGADYVFVYNDGENLGLGNGYSEGTIEFASTGIPYTFNAWTGEQTPILLYNTTVNSTIIPFQLAGNQSTMVAFVSSPLNGSTVPSEHLTSVSSGVFAVTTNASNDLTVKVGSLSPGESAHTTSSSSGTVYSIDLSAPASFSLGNWTLIAESWGPSSNLSDIGTTMKTNTTHSLSTLESWSSISGLEDSSGRGFYSTSFTWPPTTSIATDCPPTGALLDLGAIIHTARVSINGHRLPPLDLYWASADIGEYLVTGQNLVEVVIATPLLNAMRPIWEELRSSGGNATYTAAPRQEYGLVGSAMVIPYVEVGL